MAAKVFLSCGQKYSEEQSISLKIKEVLQKEFGLETYLGFKVQNLKDITKIVEMLKLSDYFIFIDFLRKNENDFPISLFSHQELALAQHFGFEEILAFKEKGSPQSEGFLKYLQANPEEFTDKYDLLKKIKIAIKARKWDKSYSRNLVVSNLIRGFEPVNYSDQTGQHLEYIWRVDILNKQNVVVAVDTVCLLDKIEFPHNPEKACDDRSYLKWAGQIGYSRTILPQDFGKLDVFALHSDQMGIFLHSACDYKPRISVVPFQGIFKFHYKVFSREFPILEFTIRINYDASLTRYNAFSARYESWNNHTVADIIQS